MASALDRQHHSHRRRRIFNSALGLQRYLSDEHRAGLRLSRSPTRPGRSVSLQRARDADTDLLMKKKKTPNAQRRTPNIEFGAGRVFEVPGREYTTARSPKYDLEERLLRFSASIVQLADSLPNTKAGNHIAGQLLRCGTSSLANHGEVEAAESRKDFLHKLRICLKELRETWRWLRLIGVLRFQ